MPMAEKTSQQALYEQNTNTGSRKRNCEHPELQPQAPDSQESGYFPASTRSLPSQSQIAKTEARSFLYRREYDIVVGRTATRTTGTSSSGYFLASTRPSPLAIADSTIRAITCSSRTGDRVADFDEKCQNSRNTFIRILSIGLNGDEGYMDSYLDQDRSLGSFRGNSSSTSARKSESDIFSYDATKGDASGVDIDGALVCPRSRWRTEHRLEKLPEPRVPDSQESGHFPPVSTLPSFATANSRTGARTFFQPDVLVFAHRRLGDRHRPPEDMSACSILSIEIGSFEWRQRAFKPCSAQHPPGKLINYDCSDLLGRLRGLIRRSTGVRDSTVPSPGGLIERHWMAGKPFVTGIDTMPSVSPLYPRQAHMHRKTRLGSRSQRRSEWILAPRK
ncbi:hypothetical protein PM082_006215 [Marasmius tenuissimus]|nr:hypothetical protein PM082_006215 [Marasmius tenuissimus]